MSATKALVSKEIYKYPSVYGSHKSMVDEKESNKVDSSQVVLRDEYGFYITDKKRLDNGLADQNRCDFVTRQRICKKMKWTFHVG